MNRNSHDPDLNLQSFNDHGIFTLQELNDLSAVVKPKFTAVHINVRSLSQHFQDMCNFIDSSAFAFDVIGLSEIWFTSHTDVNSFQIPGYTLISDNHTYSIDGGVALFVKSNFAFCIRNDLKIDPIENIWIETQDMIIGVIYKPPNFSNTDVLDKLEVTLHSIFLSRKKCLIMGDTNINTLRKTSVSKDYINMVQSEGFNPVIF